MAKILKNKSFMPPEQLIKILYRYCSKIRKNRKHYVCYPLNSKRVITVSGTPSDRNYVKHTFQQFKNKAGIIISEIQPQ